MSNQNKLASEVWVLDLDRFMVGDKLYRAYEDAVGKVLGDAHKDSLIDARIDAESYGKSFDMVEWLSQTYPETLDQIEQHFITSLEGEDVTLEGIRPLLAYLAERHIPHMILTYGGDRYQRSKIVAAGLDNIPHVISPTKVKSEVIGSWYDADRAIYEVPELGLGALAVVLCDDKREAFANMPPSTRGYWFDARGSGSDAPRATKRIDSVHEILEQESHLAE